MVVRIIQDIEAAVVNYQFAVWDAGASAKQRGWQYSVWNPLLPNELIPFIGAFNIFILQVTLEKNLLRKLCNPFW